MYKKLNRHFKSKKPEEMFAQIAVVSKLRYFVAVSAQDKLFFINYNLQ